MAPHRIILTTQIPQKLTVNVWIIRLIIIHMECILKKVMDKIYNNLIEISPITKTLYSDLKSLFKILIVLVVLLDQ